MADFILNKTGTQIQTAIDAVMTAINNGGIADQNTLNAYQLRLFPVGAIYLMSNNTNPGVLIGGTWTLIDNPSTNKFFWQRTG